MPAVTTMFTPGHEMGGHIPIIPLAESGCVLVRLPALATSQVGLAWQRTG